MIVNIYSIFGVVMGVYISTYVIWPDLLKVCIYFGICYGIIKYFCSNWKKNSFFLTVFIIFSLYTIVNGLVFFETEKRFLYGIYQYVFYVMSIFFFIQLYKRTSLRYIYMCVMAIGIINSIIAIYEFLSGDFLLLHILPSIQGDMIFQANVGDSSVVRSIGLQGSPLTLGVMCGIFAIVSYHVFILSKKNYALIIFILHTAGMICSYSRNSWFSFTLAFIFYNIFMFIYCKKNGYDVVMKRIVKSILFTIAMCAIYIMFNTDSVFINRIISMGDLTGELGEPSNALRYVLWLNIIDIILDSIENFVFGIGIAVTGNSPDAIMVPESGFLKRFVEGGLLMLVLYYTMILHCFYIVLSNIKTGVSPKSILCLSIAYLVLVDDLGLQITEQVNFSFMLWGALGYVVYEHDIKNG